jgi:hypothetical protein
MVSKTGKKDLWIGQALIFAPVDIDRVIRRTEEENEQEQKRLHKAGHFLCVFLIIRSLWTIRKPRASHKARAAGSKSDDGNDLGCVTNILCLRQTVRLLV